MQVIVDQTLNVNIEPEKAKTILKQEQLVWHYTTTQCLVKILTDGYLKPATAFVKPPEKPVVWFSTNQDWEETANKLGQTTDGSLVRLGREETAELGGGLIRIGVAPCT